MTFKPKMRGSIPVALQQAVIFGRLYPKTKPIENPGVRACTATNTPCFDVDCQRECQIELKKEHR